jgi:hypothetical protein
MSEETKVLLLKEQLREISTRVRNDLTEKFIASLVGYLRNRALGGYTFYESGPIIFVKNS